MENKVELLENSSSSLYHYHGNSCRVDCRERIDWRVIIEMDEISHHINPV
jgi:carbonic anhydrase